MILNESCLSRSNQFEKMKSDVCKYFFTFLYIFNGICESKEFLLPSFSSWKRNIPLILTCYLLHILRLY